MRIILKFLFAPVIVVLAVAIWLCKFALSFSAWFFGILGTIFAILGLAILLLESAVNGIIVLIFAFLVSPFGLPMFAVWMIGQLQRLRFFIQNAIYG